MAKPVSAAGGVEVKPGDLIMVEIRSVTATGEGLGVYQGRRVIVPGGFVGERLRVRVLTVQPLFILATRA